MRSCPPWTRTVRLLAATEVFGEVEPRELEEVARWRSRGAGSAARSSSARATSGDTCYLLRTGAVVLTREHPDGRMVALAELRAGSCSASSRCSAARRARPRPRSWSRRARVALLATDVQRLIRRNPDLALKLLASLAERVSRTNERLLQQSFQTVAGRVASALLGADDDAPGRRRAASRTC